MEHLPAVQLRLCLGALPRPARQLLEHLLDCPACREAAAPWLATLQTPPPGPVSNDLRYERAFERSRSLALARQERLPAERARARSRILDVLARPAARWVEIAEADPLLLTPAAVEVLLERADRAAAAGEPCTAAALARFAYELAGRLPAALAPETLGQLLRARSWALLGQAHAASRSSNAAVVCCAQALRIVSDHTGSEEEAEVLTRCALGALSERRFSEALAQLARAAAIYGDLGETQKAARALRRLGRVLFELGDVAQARDRFAEALLLAGSDAAGRLADDLRHQLAWALLADDDVEAARQVLDGEMPTPEGQEPQAMLLLLLLRPEPPAGFLRGEISSAEERGDVFQATLSLLLLARLLLRRDDGEELARLATQAALLAGSARLTAASRDALVRFAEALARGEVTLHLILETLRQLRPAVPVTPVADTGREDAPN
jgi:tetratricopeptide (TPR) repeat protein